MHQPLLRRSFMSFFLFSYTPPSSSQDQVVNLIFSPPILDTTQAPYFTFTLLSPSVNGAETKEELKLRTGVSICGWVSISYFRRPSVIFSLQDEDAGTWEISLALLPNALILRSRGSSKVIPTSVLPFSTNHVCLVLSSRNLSLFFNNQTLHTNPFESSELLGQNLKVYVGGGEQWPDISPMYKGAPYVNDNDFLFRNSARGAFAGEIIDPLLWEVDLSVDQMSDLARCQITDKPPLKNIWTPEGENFLSLNVTRNEPCTRELYNYFFLPKALHFDQNKFACKKFNATPLSPKLGNEYNALIDAATLFYDACGDEKWYAWLQPIKYQKDNQFPNCEALTISGQESISCTESICSGCQFESGQKLFTLRGLCPLSKADLTFFIQRNEEKLGYYFYGLERYSIIPDGDQWSLRDMALKTSLAITTDPISPIGVKTWTVVADFCGHSEGDEVTASISSCDFTEAICRDGTCVSLSKRCDSFPDCPDASDEMQCYSIWSSSTLSSELPPQPSPTQIQIHIDILRVLTIPPLKQFSLLMEFKFSWSDPRVMVTNISPGKTTLLSDQSSRLWRPQISARAPGRSSPLEVIPMRPDASSHSFISPQSEGVTWMALTLSKRLEDNRETPYIDATFAGANTTFSLIEIVTQIVDCEFDFSFFPFDEQVCILPLIISKWPSSQLVFKSPPVGRYIGPLRLLHYTLDKTQTRGEAFKLDGKVFSGIVITLHLARRPALFVLIIYLPSLFLLLLNCTTLWMKCRSENGSALRITVSCVILIFFLLQWHILGVSAPGIDHVTAIDVWLCFGIIMAILHLWIHILLDVFKEESEGDLFSRVPSRVVSSRVRDVKPVDNRSLYEGLVTKVIQMESKKLSSVTYWILFISRVVSPILLLFFNGIYWPFVLYFRINDIP